MLTALALPLLLSSQQAKPTVTFDTLKAKAGTTAKATARVAIPGGWHAYQNPPKSEYENPLTLSLGKSTVKLAGNFLYPKGKAQVFSGQSTLVYEGKVAIPFRIAVPKTAKAGAMKVPVVVKYQLCNDSTCLPPTSTTATLLVNVVK